MKRSVTIVVAATVTAALSALLYLWLIPWDLRPWMRNAPGPQPHWLLLTVGLLALSAGFGAVGRRWFWLAPATTIVPLVILLKNSVDAHHTEDANLGPGLVAIVICLVLVVLGLLFALAGRLFSKRLAAR